MSDHSKYKGGTACPKYQSQTCVARSFTVTYQMPIGIGIEKTGWHTNNACVKRSVWYLLRLHRNNKSRPGRKRAADSLVFYGTFWSAINPAYSILFPAYFYGGFFLFFHPFLYVLPPARGGPMAHFICCAMCTPLRIVHTTEIWGGCVLVGETPYSQSS